MITYTKQNLKILASAWIHRDRNFDGKVYDHSWHGESVNDDENTGINMPKTPPKNEPATTT